MDTGAFGGGRTLLTPSGARSANMSGAAPSTSGRFSLGGLAAVSANAARLASRSRMLSRDSFRPWRFAGPRAVGLPVMDSIAGGAA